MSQDESNSLPPLDLSDDHTYEEDDPGTYHNFTNVEEVLILPDRISRLAASVDAVALLYLSSSLLQDSGLSRTEIINGWFDGLPHLSEIIATHLGRIALITLPIFSGELYRERAILDECLVAGLGMAKNIGARCVTLMGLLSSATDYGRNVTIADGLLNSAPKISTGHATTAAAVSMAVAKVTNVSRRPLSMETLGILGLGSIGLAVLRTLLSSLPHPKSIMLCDIYNKRTILESLEVELRHSLGFLGKITKLNSSSKVPDDFFQSSIIIGATNVGGVLDIQRLKPGTILIDDSVPFCFSVKDAIARFEKQQDILFLSGGQLRAPHPMHRNVYIPSQLVSMLGDQEKRHVWSPNPWMITSCVLSALLTSRFDSLEASTGLINASQSNSHFAKLTELQFSSPQFHISTYLLDQRLVTQFCNQYGN